MDRVENYSSDKTRAERERDTAKVLSLVLCAGGIMMLGAWNSLRNNPQASLSVKSYIGILGLVLTLSPIAAYYYNGIITGCAILSRVLGLRGGHAIGAAHAHGNSGVTTLWVREAKSGRQELELALAAVSPGAGVTAI